MKRSSCADLSALYRFRLENEVKSKHDIIFNVVEGIVDKVSNDDVVDVCLANVTIADIVEFRISVEQLSVLIEVCYSTNALFNDDVSLAVLQPSNGKMSAINNLRFCNGKASKRKDDKCDADDCAALHAFSPFPYAHLCLDWLRRARTFAL